MVSPESKVFRLRNIPTYLDRDGVAKLIVPFLQYGKLEDVTVASLALTCEFWDRHPTKTATITLRKLPEAVRIARTAGEWELHNGALPEPLLLDDTFYGLTPLNEVEQSQHQYDCIVISGLASHPMGSWQPRGGDKSFMWIRDKLPGLVPGVRFILYGYDTKLVGSKSFQTVADLATSLINQLQTGGWSSPGSKKLTFLAHSLGGVVLKQCLYMLAGCGEVPRSILEKTKGAIFFGVPSEGMSIEDIHDMLGNQPNKGALVAEISSGSSLLYNLEQRMSGISQYQRLKFFWAYETQTTRTLEAVNGTFRRSGPETIMVSRESATGNRYTSDPTSTIQIDADHSNMVKLSSGSHLIGPIASKLQDILGSGHLGLIQGSDSLETDNSQPKEFFVQRSIEINSTNTRDSSEDLDFWDLDSIITSIRAPERDERLEQIDKSAGCSFEWAFEDPSIGLNNWLQKGDGLYWISGRPASGKSTFMKFLHNDKRTSQLLRGWYSKAEHVEANFFFHYRGSLIQKSFEGLLRSILSQILEQAPAAFSIIHSMFQNRYQQLIEGASLGSLYLDLEDLFSNAAIELRAEMKSRLLPILACEVPIKLFRTMVVEPLRASYGSDVDWKEVQQIMISLREELLEFLKQKKLRERLLGQFLPVHYPEWSFEMKDHFVSLLADWLDAIDLKGKLLSLKELYIHQSQELSATLTSAETKFIQGVEGVMHRYHRREKIRQSAQTEPWTLQKLEKAFSQVINQQSIDLDLCIFIDALDEHDGPPEFIAEFLKDITQQKNTRTRLKILFSSRPWDQFMEAFHNCPGFRIHEHTENDIRELCIHVIQTECPGSQELLQLVDEIVKRAKGVFLWVKLVLQDLSKIARGALRREDTQTLSRELQETLQALPDGLVEYYSTIIERLSQSFRRKAFCLLEVVAKGETIYLADVPKILSCLDFSRFSDREHILEHLDELSLQDLAICLRTYTGGLIETYGKPQSPKLQLLHQTTVNFVQLPEFKNLILGSGAHIMSDNGYTFLTKLSLLQGLCHNQDVKDGSWREKDFFRYANYSEKTTGKSLYSFFVEGGFELDRTFLPAASCVSRHKRSSLHSDVIEMAFGAHLRLFINDFLRSNPAILSQTTACCAHRIIESFKSELCGETVAVQMIHNLGRHAFHFELHADCLASALFRMRTNVRGSNNHSLDVILLSVIRNFTHLDVTVRLDTLGEIVVNINGNGNINVGEDVGNTAKLLHLSSYKITKDLLKRKADPNMEDVHGNTPLDGYAMGYFGSSSYDLDELRRLMVILARNGGRLNKCSKKEWENRMNAFREWGIDVSVFERQKFPKWIKMKKGIFRMVVDTIFGLG